MYKDFFKAVFVDKSNRDNVKEQFEEVRKKPERIKPQMEACNFDKIKFK